MPFPKNPYHTLPSPQAEMDCIARFIRDTNNATGGGDDGWRWDEVNLTLTIYNTDGTIAIVSGEHLVEACPDDKRLDGIRHQLWVRRYHPKRKKISSTT